MSLLMFNAMTSTISRRLFEDLEPVQPSVSRDTATLREQGMIRVQGIIPTALNERIKAAARRQNLHADQLVGKFIVNSAIDLEKVEAQEEVARLRERFGDDWLNVLQGANP